MTPRVPDIADAELAQLVEAMNTTGYAVVPQFLGGTDLAAIRAFATAAIRRAGVDYASFIGRAAVAGSGLDVISQARSFKALMHGVYERGSGAPRPDRNIHQVLRCLDGKGARRHAYTFHYDSYLVTALLPIEIPTDGQAGDLLLLPNIRRVRSRYLVNALDKILLGNPLSQILLRTLLWCGLLRYQRLKMIPGNLYLFWGYRSIHANEPCDRLRATALFHYANPHTCAAMAAAETQVIKVAA